MKELERKHNKDLHDILHPYVFVLKEGFEIDANLLDYSLLMLKVDSQEIIQSPGSEKIMQFLPTALTLNLPGEPKPTPHEKP